MNILLFPIIIPVIAGAAVLIIPKNLKGVKELIALTGALLAAYYAVQIFFTGMEFAVSVAWFEIENLHLAADLRVDSLSAFILLASSVFAVLLVIYSIGFMKDSERQKEYYCYLLWTSGAASMALLADNLLLLLIGWEITTALLFLLITMGGKNSSEAAGKTFIIVGLSDCAMLLGIVLLWHVTGTMRISEMQSMLIDSGMLTTIYILLLTGALVKAGAMPGHSWIPTAAEGAPASVMAYLPASLDKLLGIYLLARISLHMFVLNPTLKLLLLVIGGVTIILAVLMALVQHNLKKLLAFHAVSQVGYMVMGIGTGVPIGIIGGLFHMLNHAIYKCCLFLGAGAIEKRAGTTELEKLGGLSKALPVTFGAMLIASFSISGVPPFNGFVSKWMVYQGTIEIGRPIFLLVAMFGSALTLASFIKVIHSVFLGRKPEEIGDVKPEGFTMGFPMVVLAALCVLFGVLAQIPLRYAIGPAVGMDFETAPGMIVLSRGIWSPTLATILLCVSLLIGWLIYLSGTIMKVRTTSVFVGGEKFDSETIRYPGTGFYETIRKLSILKVIYADAEQGIYDLYVLGGRYGMKIVGILKLIHNGVVSTYVAFSMIGLVFLLFYLVR
ncbi:NAD(P)H-quinone oxidoreductase subunit 2, chloroplastic [subsurface metagenome]